MLTQISVLPFPNLVLEIHQCFVSSYLELLNLLTAVDVIGSSSGGDIFIGILKLNPYCEEERHLTIKS